MVVCGIDFETTGLDTENDRVTQMAAVKLDWDTKRIVESFECHVYSATYPEITPEAAKVTGLSTQFLIQWGRPPLEVWGKFHAFVLSSDVACAHNGYNFDYLIMDKAIREYAFEPLNTPRIDTSVDINYPKNMSCKRLQHLAVDHGISARKAHTALDDVTVMLEILSKYEIGEILERAKSPLVKVIGEPGYENRQLAKDRRFRWNAGERYWERLMKEFDVDNFLKDCPFRTRVERGTEKGNDIQEASRQVPK